jgi:hypothetical protein
VGIELDMDHGTIEFSVNGRTIGPVTGVPDAGSGLVMHIAVCMFRAGDSIEATAGGRDYMLANAELVRKGKPVGISGHGPSSSEPLAWRIAHPAWISIVLIQVSNPGVTHICTAL